MARRSDRFDCSFLSIVPQNDRLSDVFFLGTYRNRDVTGHPNTKVSNEPVGAILGADSNLGLWWISEGFEVSSDLLRFGDDFIVREGEDFALAHRLGKPGLVTELLDVGEEVVNDSFVGHGSLIGWLIVKSKLWIG